MLAIPGPVAVDLVVVGPYRAGLLVDGGVGQLVAVSRRVGNVLLDAPFRFDLTVACGPSDDFFGSA